MVQHVTVTAHSNGTVTTHPHPIRIFRDDQLIRFSLGTDTNWGKEGHVGSPIVFGPGWPGGEAHPDVNFTYLADGNNALPPDSPPQTYHVTFFVTHVSSDTGIKHDPEVENMPEP